MLLLFRFSNFRSFKEETVLDMRTGSSHEYSDHIRLEGVDKVLPITAIYGANGSGKSNVIRALSDMVSYIQTSFAFDDQIKNLPWEIAQPSYPFEPHFFKKEKPVSFEVYFTMPYKEKVQYFNYGFSLDDEGIMEEWLGKAYQIDMEKSLPFTMLFERKRGEKLFLDRSIEKYKENIELSLQKKVLLLSLGTKLKMELLSKVFQWFTQFIFLNAQKQNDPFSLSDLAKKMFDKEEVKNSVLDYIRSFDTSIVDIHVVKGSFVQNSLLTEEQYQIYFIHAEQSGDSAAIPLEDESAGTIKMMSLYLKLQDSLQNGSIFVADDLDIHLHPLLMRYVILNFIDAERNPKKAQLLFTTHNTTFMDMDLLRRDEIWFTDKNDSISELYSLDDIQETNENKIHKEDHYAKRYLLGRYGAIPHLY